VTSAIELAELQSLQTRATKTADDKTTQRPVRVGFISDRWQRSSVIRTMSAYNADTEEENLFAKKAGCRKGLQPINAGYHTHNKTKIDQIYTNITC